MKDFRSEDRRVHGADNYHVQFQFKYYIGDQVMTSGSYETSYSQRQLLPEVHGHRDTSDRLFQIQFPVSYLFTKCISIIVKES